MHGVTQYYPIECQLERKLLSPPQSATICHIHQSAICLYDLCHKLVLLANIAHSDIRHIHHSAICYRYLALSATSSLLRDISCLDL